MIVVGSPNSSNSQRLKEVALRAGCPQAALVQRAADIDWAPTATSAASASPPAPPRLKSWSRKSSTPSPPLRRACRDHLRRRGGRFLPAARALRETQAAE